jgi:uncharacterized phage protein gp47/JayE
LIVGNMSFNDLMNAALTSLSNVGLPVYPGAIARALIEVQNQFLATYYNTLDFNLTMAYVSTAQGSFLDLIGALLQCTRQSLESDANYQYRIVNQVTTLAAANQTSLRIQILNVSGVRDVIMQPFTSGSGSFSVMVIPEVAGPVDPSLLQTVQNVISSQEGYGINGQVLVATMIPVDIAIQLALNGNSNVASVAALVQQNVSNYIANLASGQTLVYNVLDQTIMNASTAVSNFAIASFDVDGLPVPLADQQAAWNEVFYPENIVVS